MAWLTADDDAEYLWMNKPQREINGIRYWVIYDCEKVVILREFATNTLIGRKLTWEDDPVEI